MINEKQQILGVINTLPDNTTWDDALYTLYLHSKLEKSREDIKNGRVITLQELKNYINRLEEKYEAGNIWCCSKWYRRNL